MKKLLSFAVVASFAAHGATTTNSVPSMASPKLMLRTSTGYFRNRVENTTTDTVKVLKAPTFGGVNLGFWYYLTPRLAAGLGYKADFDLVRSSLPFRGFDLSGRFYPFGPGTLVRKAFESNILEFHSDWASYIVGDFAQRGYLLVPEGAAEADVMRGSFAAVNFGLGLEVKMSRHFEANAEVVTSLFKLAASDPNVRIGSTLFNFGINYVW